MNDVEKLLFQKKEELLKLSAPENLINILINTKTRKKHKIRLNVKYIRYAISIIILLCIVVNVELIEAKYNWIKGCNFENVNSIKDLYEKGEVQDVNKSCTFEDGTEVFLDGIIIDGKYIMIYYRYKSDTGADSIYLNEVKPRNFLADDLKHENANYLYNEEQKTFYNNSIFKLEESLLMKKYTAYFTQRNNNTEEIRKIDFNIDYNKIVSYKYLKEIKRKIKTKNGEIIIDKIEMTPIISKLYLKYKSNVDVFSASIDTNLEIDGKIYEGGGVSAESLEDEYIHMEVEYDGRFEDFDKELKIESLVLYEDILVDGNNITLSKDAVGNKMVLDDCEIILDSYKVNDNKTEFILKSEKDYKYGFKEGSGYSSELLDNKGTINCRKIIIEGEYESVHFAMISVSESEEVKCDIIVE